MKKLLSSAIISLILIPSALSSQAISQGNNSNGRSTSQILAQADPAQQIQSLFEEAQQLTADKKYQQAEQKYQQILNIVTQATSADNPELAQVHFSLGVLDHKQQNLTAAKADYEDAIRVNPEFIPAIINLGLIAYEAGEVDKAVQYWQSAIEINNDSSVTEAKLAVAVTLYRQGKQEQGLTLTKQALSENIELGNVAVLKQNLWGNRLLQAAEILLAEDQIQTFVIEAKKALELNQQAAQLYKQERYTEAEPLYQEALAIRKRLFSQDHSDVAASLDSLAKLYKAQERYTEAEPLLKQALAMRKRLYSEQDDLGVANSLYNLAELYKAQERYAKAEPLYKQALEIFKRLFPSNHLFMIPSLNNLAELYKSQGRYTKAEPLYQEALEIFKRLYPQDHSLVATYLNNLGELYRAQERYTKAEPLLQQALAMSQRLYPQDHPDVTLRFNNLAALYSDQGRYTEAEPLLQQALAMSQRLYPQQDHPNVATNLNNLAALYKSQGRYTEAEPLLQQALATSQRLYPQQDQPNVATNLNNLAVLYKSQGRYTKAEPLYQKALAMSQRLYPQQDHPDVALRFNNLAALYHAQGRYGEAESLLKQALAMRKRLYSDDHPDTAQSLNNLAELYRAQERYSEAEPLYQDALAMFKRLYPDDHPNLATSLSNLGLLYHAQRRYGDAESLLKQALAMRKRLFYPNDHPDLALSLNNLGLLYHAQGRYGEAKPLYQNALAIFKGLFPQDHRLVALSLSNLGIFYQAQGQYPQALNYLTQAAKVQETIIAENLLIGSEQQKKQFLNLFQGNTNGTISFHLTAIPNNLESAQLALTTILRRKGRILDATGQALQTLRDNLDPESKKLFVQLASNQTELANLSSLPLPDDSTQRRNIQTQQAELDKQIKQLEAQLSSRSAEFKQETTPVTIEQVQQAIPENAALVEFIQYKPFDAKESTYGEPRYAVYVLLPDGQMRWQDLGEALVIDDKIQRFRTLLGNGGERGLGAVQAESGIDATKQVARELDDLLMKPVREMVGNATHLLLSPDSQLNTLPFAALVDEQDKYLVENYLITYLTSGRDLLRLQLNQNQDTSKPILLANPTYSSQGVAVATADTKADKEDDTRGRRSGELGKLEFTSLPGTKEEGEAIKELVPDIKVYTEQEASENNLKQTKNPEFLHLATHGFFLPPQEEELNNSRNRTLSLDNQTPVLSTAENPLLRSGLALAGFNQRDSGTEDGVLTALEVTGLNLRGTKLVVMSACETGLGDVQAGEGVYGLRRAFTLAGAQSQLMSLWSVDDDGTKDLMVDYYRRIQNGEARGEALRQVQLEMLQSENRNHPFFWAAFIPSGSWLPLDSSD